MPNSKRINHDVVVLQALIDSSDKLIAALDCNLKYIAFNHQYRDEVKKFFGKEVEIGMSIQDALCNIPEEKNKSIVYWNDAINGKTTTVIKEFDEKAATKKYYKVHYIPLYDAQKNLVGATHIGYDITEQKQIENTNQSLEQHVKKRTAELEKTCIQLVHEIKEREKIQKILQELTNQHNLTLEAAQIGAWHWDIINNKVTSDSRHKELFQLQEKADCKAEDTFDRVHMGDRQNVVQKINRSLLDKTFFEDEFRVVWPDKSIHWLAGRGEVICDADGNPTHMAGVNWDITEKKAFEEQIYKQQQQLADISKLLSISETASNVAHELNQPLTAIATYAQLCAAQIENNKVDLQELLSYLKHIIKQSLRAGEIIHKIKEFSQHKSLSFELASVNDLITETLSHISHLKKSNAFNVTLNFAENLPLIELDKVQLQQVIINIILNALEAMQAKNMTDGEIIITTKLADTPVEIYIQNNGPPIPEHLHKKIFDAYFTTKATGMGIGLSMCRTILEAHKGDLILLYSSKKDGTCFKLSLPAS